MRHRAVHVATWILSRLVSKGEREPLLGDLAEEYALRANTASASAAFKWYLQQICASAPALLYAKLTRSAWIVTAGVALLAYIAVGLVELIVNRAISSSLLRIRRQTPRRGRRKKVRELAQVIESEEFYGPVAQSAELRTFNP